MQIKSDTLFQHKMIDLRVIHKRLSSRNQSRTLIPILIPMFLIISSSVYPAILSSMENKEAQIISKVMAELEQQKDNVISNRYQALMEVTNSNEITPSSPTPIDPPPLASPSIPNQVDATPMAIQQEQQQEGDNKMVANVINPGEQVHTVWSDQSSGNFDIFYKRDGSDYDPTIENLSNNIGNSLEPAIAVSGSNVHIVWSDTTSGNPDILYKRSITSGAFFGSIINLSANTGTSGSPQIAVSGNNVHIVWHDSTPGDFDIIYRRSTDGGASFEPEKNLSSNSEQSAFPDIAISGSSVHVVWRDFTPGNPDILYRRSTDNGNSFPNIIKNISGNAGFSDLPSIASSGNNIHVVWFDNTGLSADDILYRRSLDNGSTFPNVIKNLSGTLGSSFNPSIVASDNIIHVVWSDNTLGSFDIKYRRSLDNGSTFPNVIKNISSNLEVFESSSSPEITTSGSNVYVVWQNIPGEGDSEIGYRTSANNGNTFPADLTNLSANDGDSFTPQIAVS
jgi:hypothetical protein